MLLPSRGFSFPFRMGSPAASRAVANRSIDHMGTFALLSAFQLSGPRHNERDMNSTLVVHLLESPKRCIVGVHGTGTAIVREKDEQRKWHARKQKPHALRNRESKKRGQNAESS